MNSRYTDLAQLYSYNCFPAGYGMENKFFSYDSSLITAEIVGRWPHLLTLSKDHWMVSDLISVAKEVRRSCKYVIIIGMGGAILNPKAVLDFLSYDVANDFDDSAIPIKRFYWLNDLCDESIDATCAAVNLEEAAVIAISNSGETIETIAILKELYKRIVQIRLVISNADSIKNSNDVGFRALIYITENEGSTLGKLCQEYKGIFVKYDAKFGGRFATFTSIVLLPLMICGYDVGPFFLGAEEVIRRFIDGQNAFLARSITDFSSFYSLSALKEVFTFTYDVKLSQLINWYSIAVTETFGRYGYGINMQRGILPLEQHGQMQLLLSTPQNKVVNIFSVSNGTIEVDPVDPLSLSSVKFLCHQEVVKRLQFLKIPIRFFTVNGSGLQHLGAMMMHLIIETVAVAVSHGIDAFAQPDIDELKLTLSKNLHNQEG